VAKAAPLPIFRTVTQAACDGVAVNVTELFNELFVIAYIEIVISLVPEVPGFADQATRDPLFQRLDGYCKRLTLRFAEEQVYVLRHDHIRIDANFVATANPLKRGFEGLLSCGLNEQRAATITTEGHEVSLSGFVKTLQAPRHTER